MAGRSWDGISISTNLPGMTAPFLSLSRPCCAAVRTLWPSRYGRADRNRRGLIEKNQHPLFVNWRCIEAAGRELDYCLDLLPIQTVKPLHDVVDVGSSLDIFEDGGNGHPRSSKHPCAADLSRNALDFRA